jgi:hypothetical protein
MSMRWRDHADHHMGVLLSPAGSFARSFGTTDPGDLLPRTSTSRGQYVDVRTIAD